MTHRVAELDGIRGLAILGVMLFHFLGHHPHAPALAMPLLIGGGFGWAGVDLFFVLSGFLITGILLDSRDSQYYFRLFY